MRVLIEMSRLSAVIDRAVTDEDDSSGVKLTRVDPIILETTATKYPECRCEDFGLHAGMTMRALSRLETGCTGPSYACSRLVKIRNHYQPKGKPSQSV